MLMESIESIMLFKTIHFLIFNFISTKNQIYSIDLAKSSNMFRTLIILLLLFSTVFLFHKVIYPNLTRKKKIDMVFGLFRQRQEIFTELLLVLLAQNQFAIDPIPNTLMELTYS